MNRALFSSRSIEWYTPQWLIVRVKEVLGEIDLDPASNAIAQEVVQARHWCGFDHPDPAMRDGLSVDWSNYQTVFINPPYGRHIGKFAERIAEYGKIMPIAALVPARTNTRWWRTMVSVPHVLVVPPYRIPFWSPYHDRTPSSPPFPVVMLWYNVPPETIRPNFRDCTIYTPAFL